MLKKYKNYIFLGIAAIIILTVAFFSGRGAKKDDLPNSAPSETAKIVPETPTHTIFATPIVSEEAVSTIIPTAAASPKETLKPTEAQKKAPVVADESEQKSDIVLDEYKTEPIPSDKPKPVEPTEVTKKTEYKCTLSVRCDTILNNMSKLDPNKQGLVPKDGMIFSESEVIFYEGESVFNVLLREMKKNKIHFEFVNTPIYNSAYIEGINNLYEFDCGELSGWMYRVNDWFPNYGVSRYLLKENDKIELIYTCDLGKDIGGEHSFGGQK